MCAGRGRQCRTPDAPHLAVPTVAAGSGAGCCGLFLSFLPHAGLPYRTSKGFNGALDAVQFTGVRAPLACALQPVAAQPTPFKRTAPLFSHSSTLPPVQRLPSSYVFKWALTGTEAFTPLLQRASIPEMQGSEVTSFNLSSDVLITASPPHLDASTAYSLQRTTAGDTFWVGNST